MGNPVGMTRTVSSRRYHRESGERVLSDVVFDSCSFDSCRVRGGTFTGVELRSCRVWSCGLEDVVLRSCTVDGLRMTVEGGAGGRTMPLIVRGVLADRLTLRGVIGSLIWNPPGSPDSPVPDEEAARIGTDFYATVSDFALDIREAQFTAIPSLRFGPPGHLVLRDPGTQPLIELAEARRVLAADGAALGVWRVVLADFVRRGWPDSKVLVPAVKAPRKQREKTAAELDHLRSIAHLS